MTAEWIVAHARRQQRHYRWQEAAHRWLPRPWHARASALLARSFSSELPDAPKVWRGLQQFSGCSDAAAHHFLGQWYANQGAFAIELHDYPRLDAAWARDRVRCDERDVLAQVVARGGLVLEYHSFHHNRLGAWLGLSGTRVWGIAATEDNSPWKPWTGRWVRLINGGSEALFGGGRYLYTDQMRDLLRESRAALERGETVVSLCDNPSDHPGAVRVDFAGRILPVATGMIDLALAVGAPISYALFYSDLAGGHRVRLAPAPGRDAAAVAQGYVSQLMQWLHEDLFAWQGWLWWDDLARSAPETEADRTWRETADARYEASRPAPSWKARMVEGLGRVQMRLAPPSP